MTENWIENLPIDYRTSPKELFSNVLRHAISGTSKSVKGRKELFRLGKMMADMWERQREGRKGGEGGMLEGVRRGLEGVYNVVWGIPADENAQLAVVCAGAFSACRLAVVCLHGRQHAECMHANEVFGISFRTVTHQMLSH